jgi:hypothetical protein
MEAMQRVGVIHLANGGFAIVDPEWLVELNRFKWRLGAGGYAVTTNPGKSRHIKLHQMVLNAPVGLEVDHRNGVRLDNRSCNLRFATRAENSANAGKRANTSSCFKGVSWDKERRRWHAMIKVNYKAMNLGRFDSEVEGAQAYNAAALKHFGEFARLNAIP